MTEAAESTPAVADRLARARVYVEGSHAKQTLEAYAADWKHFNTWCEEHKRRSLPAAPETIALRADAKRHHLLPGGDGRLLLYGTVGKKALSGLAVSRIVKESLTRAGIDAKDDSGHSLRAGRVTAAAMAGSVSGSSGNALCRPGSRLPWIAWYRWL